MIPLDSLTFNIVNDSHCVNASNEHFQLTPRDILFVRPFTILLKKVLLEDCQAHEAASLSELNGYLHFTKKPNLEAHRTILTVILAKAAIQIFVKYYRFRRVSFRRMLPKPKLKSLRLFTNTSWYVSVVFHG